MNRQKKLNKENALHRPEPITFEMKKEEEEKVNPIKIAILCDNRNRGFI